MVQLKAKLKGGKKTNKKIAVIKPVKVASPQMKKTLKKGKKPKEIVKPDPVEEEESEETSESEIDLPVLKQGTGSKLAMNKADSDEEESDFEIDDDDDDDDDDDSVEEVKQKMFKGKKPAQVAEEDSEEEDDENESEEDDDDDEDESEAKADVAQASKKDDDEDSDDEEGDEEEEDSDEEDEEEEEMEIKTNLKRKKETPEQTQAKKPKTAFTGEMITMMFTNLPEGLNDSVFNKFLKGKGIQCLACRANYGRQKAFVDIKKADQSKAVGIHQVEWKGQEINVEEAVPKSQERQNKQSDKDERTLFVKNLPYSADEDAIKDLFEGVKEVRLLKERDSGRPKGMGFIEFNSKEEKATAYGMKDDLEMDGRSLFLDHVGGGGRGGGARGRGRDSLGRGGRGGGRGGSRGPSNPSKTLFVKGITEDMTRETLLESFGGAADVRIPTDRETGKNKFFAYIEYASEQDATEVYKSSKGGMQVDDSKLFVDYAAERRSDGGGGGGFRGGGRGGRGGGRGRGFGRGRGRGGGGAFAKNKGSIQHFEGKRTKFDDSD